MLARLGPTPAARAAKAPTDRERGFLEAVEVLWSDEGTYNERRVGYMEAMERLYERYPDDDESGDVLRALDAGRIPCTRRSVVAA